MYFHFTTTYIITYKKRKALPFQNTWLNFFKKDYFTKGTS